MLCLLGCLYLSLGGAILAHPPSLPPFDYYPHDITYPVNPYGVAEIGWDSAISRHLDLSIALRHMSSLGLDWEMRSFNYQWGTNSAEIRVRWFPFREEQMTDLSQQLITEEEGPSSPTVYYVNGVAHIGRGVCVDSRLHVEGLPSAVLHQLDALKLAEATNLAQKLPGYFQCNEVRQAILVSMCYQLGNLSLWPHLRAALSAGDWEAAAEAMRNSRWVEQTPARAKRAISMMLTGQWQPKE